MSNWHVCYKYILLISAYYSPALVFVQSVCNSKYTPVADLGFRKGGFQCALDCYTWRSVIMKAREARPLGGSGGMPPRKIFLISDLLRPFLVPFWGKIARVGRPTANLVIVFEAFKRSQNLKAWLRFAPAPQRLQSSREAREKKRILAGYCTRSVVSLWS